MLSSVEHEKSFMPFGPGNALITDPILARGIQRKRFKNTDKPSSYMSKHMGTMSKVPSKHTISDHFRMFQWRTDIGPLKIIFLLCNQLSLSLSLS